MVAVAGTGFLTGQSRHFYKERQKEHGAQEVILYLRLMGVGHGTRRKGGSDAGTMAEPSPENPPSTLKPETQSPQKHWGNN